MADIHFDYQYGDLPPWKTVRIRSGLIPGNIGSPEQDKGCGGCVRKSVQLPIRVGVNSGSLERNLVEKYGGVTAEGIVESALDKVHSIEDLGYDNLVISIKSSDVMMCVKAHELLAEKTHYPSACGNYGIRNSLEPETLNRLWGWG